MKIDNKFIYAYVTGCSLMVACLILFLGCDGSTTKKGKHQADRAGGLISDQTRTDIPADRDPSALPDPFSEPADEPFVEINRDALKQKYASLLQQQVETLSDGSKKIGDSRYFIRGGINVLVLKGDWFEMAYHHGKLLKERIPGGAMPRLIKMVSEMIQDTVGSALITSIADFFFSNVLQAPLYKDLKAIHREEIYAISLATGIEEDQFFKTLAAPETIQMIGGKALGLLPGSAAFTGTQCSSFAAWGSHTANGNMIIGRNLDYAMNGTFDKETTVMYMIPSDGSQRLVSITSSGLHMAGLTAYNEAGIYIAVHTTMTPNVFKPAKSGSIGFSMATDVISKARNFDEAIKLFKQKLPAAGWTYLVVSTKEKRVASIEMNNDAMVVRDASGDFHAQTNHYITSGMKDQTLFLNGTVQEDTTARYNRLIEMGGEYAGRIDAQTAIRMMSDQTDPIYKRVRAVGNTVSVHLTVGSVVVDPQNRRMFVANGLAPVTHNEYIEFPLWFADVEKEFESGRQFVTFDNNYYRQSEPTQYQGMKKFLESKTAYEIEKNTKKAYDLMKETVAIDSSNPVYFIDLAILAMKNNDIDFGMQQLDKVLSMDHANTVKALARYYKARVLAHKGQNDAAKEELKKVEADPAAADSLKSAAKMVRLILLVKSYTFDAAKVPIILQVGDAYMY